MIQALTCPICQAELPPGAVTESRWFPFCCERCRNVDLYRWSEGRYSIVEPLGPEHLGEAAETEFFADTEESVD